MESSGKEARRGTEGPRPKRLKIDVACETCRLKKVRCDGVRPACGYCSRKLSLRDSCRYSNGDSNEQPTSQGLSSNHTPVHPFRSRPAPAPGPAFVRDSPNQYSASSPSGVTRSDSARTPASTTLPDGSHRGPPSHPGSISRGPSFRGPAGVTAHTTSPSIIDSMTTVVDEGTSTLEVFGSSSAGSFTAQIKRAIDSRLNKPPPTTSHHDGRNGSGTTTLPPQPGPPALDVTYVLPQRRQADHLMDLYWTYVDPLYPFLDRTRWHGTYEAIFAGTRLDVDERLFVATLNVILALSTQLAETLAPEARERASAGYMQRAQELQPLHMLDPASTELVQYLLLTGQFLQSTDQPHMTWMVVASAIRNAQSLGMHLCETSAERRDAEEAALLRRIWYGCVLMDRMVSVTHGRPAMISGPSATAVPLPTPAPFTPSTTDRVSFFVKSVRLYEIINRTLVDLYGGPSRPKQPHGSDTDMDTNDPDDDDLDLVVRLDRCLTKWHRRIPAHLRWESLDTNPNETHRRQTVILRTRHLHARMLLLRPLLSRFCLAQTPSNTSTSDNLQSRVVREGALLCVATAQDTIADLVRHQTHDGSIGLLPAWWYRVYYIYTAATILIAARLRPEAFPVVSLARSWAQAMGMLKAHEGFRPSVRRCVAALHILSSKILESAPEGPAGGGSAGVSRRQSDAGAGDGGGLGGLQETGAFEEGMGAFGVDEFAPPATDLGGLDLADFNFDVHDFSWLHDMHTTWELLNE